jgi:hypothetical protein
MICRMNAKRDIDTKAENEKKKKKKLEKSNLMKIMNIVKRIAVFDNSNHN